MLEKTIVGCAVVVVTWFVIGMCSPVLAATCTWTGASDANLATGGNWTGCEGNPSPNVPTDGDTLVFGAAAGGSYTNDLPDMIVLETIQFTNLAGSTTITGTNMLSMLVSITTQSPGDIVLDTPIGLEEDVTISNTGGGTISMPAGIAMTSHALALTGTDMISFGALSGTGSVTSSNTFLSGVRFRGESTGYSGDITVTDGRIYGWRDQGFGVNNTITLNGGCMTVSEEFGNINDINSSIVVQPASSGCIINAIGDDNIFVEPITINASSVAFGVSGGELVINEINGAGGVVIDSGQVVFTGLTANTYQGDTIIEDGAFLTLNKEADDLPAIIGDVIMNGTGGFGSLVSNVIADTSTISMENGFFGFADGGSDTVGTVSGGGTIEVGTGSTLVIQQTANSAEFTGVISGEGSVVKAGSGTLLLSGNIVDHNGELIVTSGELRTTGGYDDGVSSVLRLAGGTYVGQGALGSFTTDADTTFMPLGELHVQRSSSLGEVGTAVVSYIFQANGTSAGDEYYQLWVDGGTTTLANVILSVDLGYVPTVGDQLMLLTTSGGGNYEGTFNGLNENDTFESGGVTWRINYTAQAITLTVMVVGNAPEVLPETGPEITLSVLLGGMLSVTVGLLYVNRSRIKSRKL